MREKLPLRRSSEVVAFNHISPLGHPTSYTATIGYYPDGRIGEVFVDGKMSSSEAGALAHDAAVLISIALQHGVPMIEMQSAMGRGDDHRPHSIIGSTLDLLRDEERRHIDAAKGVDARAP
jgi:hypothetical protein